MSHWPQLPIRRVFRVVNGGTPTADEENWEGDVPWATPVDLSAADGVIRETRRTLTQHGATTGSRIVPAGSLLVSTRAPIGYVARAEVATAFNQGCRALVPIVGMDVRFFAYQLEAMTQQLQSRGQATTFSELAAESLASMPVTVPLVEEQRRVADFLNVETARIATLISTRNLQRKLLEERRAATIARLVLTSPKPGVSAVRTGNRWVPYAPAHWEILPLKRRWTIIDCKHRTPTYLDQGYPVISPGDVTSGRLDLSRAHRFVSFEDFSDLADATRRPRRGDIVYSRNATIGIAAYVDTEEPFTMGQDVCRVTSGEQSQLYLTYVLNTLVSRQLEELEVGSTFTRINVGSLLQLWVPCPPPEEQRVVAKELDDACAYIDRTDTAIQRQLDLLAERRRALITAAATGQMDVATARGVR